MAKILFEFLAQENMDNVISQLHGRFDRAVFFCMPSEAADAHRRERLTAFLERRFGCRAEFTAVKAPTLSDVAAALAAAVSPDNDYTLDLTGGSELFIAGAGYFLRQYTGDNIEIELYDVRKDRLIYSAPFPETGKRLTELSLEDYFEMEGSKLLLRDDGLEPDFGSAELRAEIQKVWAALKDIPADWNRFCSLAPTDPDQEDADAGWLARKMVSDAEKHSSERVMRALKKQGLITGYRTEAHTNSVSMLYRFSPQAATKLLYEKGGTYLEMYTAMAARDSGLFTDVSFGVSADLDGVLTGKPGDPHNEFDVVAIRSNTPLFISCKNTRPTKEFLYEILTMAHEYGGKYARAALVSTVSAFSPVRERAEEMGVLLIDRTAGMTLKEIKKALEKSF